MRSFFFENSNQINATLLPKTHFTLYVTQFTRKDGDHCTKDFVFISQTWSWCKTSFRRDTCAFGYMCYPWDTIGETKDSESSFVASSQYLGHSWSPPEGQQNDAADAVVAVGGVGGGQGGQGHGGQNLPQTQHQSNQLQHHHCFSLRVTRWYGPFLVGLLLYLPTFFSRKK